MATKWFPLGNVQSGTCDHSIARNKEHAAGGCKDSGRKKAGVASGVSTHALHAPSVKTISDDPAEGDARERCSAWQQESPRISITRVPSASWQVTSKWPLAI